MAQFFLYFLEEANLLLGQALYLQLLSQSRIRILSSKYIKMEIPSIIKNLQDSISLHPLLIIFRNFNICKFHVIPFYRPQLSLFSLKAFYGYFKISATQIRIIWYDFQLVRKYHCNTPFRPTVHFLNYYWYNFVNS